MTSEREAELMAQVEQLRGALTMERNLVKAIYDEGHNTGDLPRNWWRERLKHLDSALDSQGASKSKVDTYGGQKNIGEDRTIHWGISPIDGKTFYSISLHQCWMPGSYESEEAAVRAFDFDDEVLIALQESVNPGGTITFEMLQKLRKGHD